MCHDSATMLRPTIFGKLCLLERISVGGMAEVFRAKPFNAPEVERYLAVKRILPTLAEDEEFVNMFVDEAKIAILFNHPNIVQSYELAKLADSHFIVMEFVAGHDLLTIQKRLRRNRKVMAVSQAVYTAAHVASALHHAHECADEEGRPLDIVHRDISPQNVLISYAGEVKLIDFGIAKVATQTMETQVGVLKGKFSYMSPEQVRGRPVDRRSDLFALGIVLYELLTGRRLFHGESDFHTLEKVRAARIEPPSTLNARIPPELDALVLKSLAREPEDRFQTGEEMCEALLAFLDAASAPYDQAMMSDWMVQTFARELEQERKAREAFAQFVTPDDVRSYNAARAAELREVVANPVRAAEGTPSKVTGVTSVAPAMPTTEPGSPVLQLGSLAEEEVLAENVARSLPSVLGGDLLAHFDLPAVRSESESAYYVVEPEPPLRWGLLAALFVLVAAGAAAAAWAAQNLGEPPAPAPPAEGIVRLDVRPADDLQIFFDGALVATRAPTVIEAVRAGDHVIEVRHPRYEPRVETLRIEAGQAPLVILDLMPRTERPAGLHVRVDPPDAEIWLDGALVEHTGSDPLLVLTGDRAHDIDIQRSGYRVWSDTLELPPGAVRTLDVQLQPLQADLEIHSDTPGTVLLDGEILGDTANELIIEGLDPKVPVTLRIEPLLPGFRPYERVIVFEGAVSRDVHARLDRLGEPTGASPEVGWVALEAGETWHRVLVDGRDTGLTTPIPVDDPLALAAGRRVITLERDGRRAELALDVVPGDPLLVDCSDPVWDCRLR